MVTGQANVHPAGRTWPRYTLLPYNGLGYIIVFLGGYMSSGSIGIRWVAGAWCLVSVVLLYGYSSNLISYLTVPRLESVPKDLNDLAFNYKHISLTMEKNRFFAKWFTVSRNMAKVNAKPEIMYSTQDATEGPIKILGDSLRKDPKNLYSKHEELVDTLSRRHHATVMV